MRHTSGLTYGFTGVSPVQKLVMAADVASQKRTLAENVEAIAALPLMHQPGDAWSTEPRLTCSGGSSRSSSAPVWATSCASESSARWA